MNLVRQYQLDSQYRLISSAMQLRRPQADSLQTVRDLLAVLPASISELDGTEIAETCRQLDPNWSFPWGYPSLTFSLATGVGKTRLIGAIAAYLFRMNESRNFLILAPRDAILRKFEQDVREASKNYLFVDSGLVAQPHVCHRSNLDTYRPSAALEGLTTGGPNLFIFSPQLLITRGRISTPSEFLGLSIEQYLKECDDLVVFFDESQYISSIERDEMSDSWGGALTALKPKLVFEMTATPREGAAIAYEYNLPQCLRERLYTKAVRLIVDETGANLPEDEYDQYTLRFALSRLRAKEDALQEIQTQIPGFPPLTPVVLIAASTIAHANTVEKLLKDEFEFEDDEVLVIHSKRKTEDDMTALAAIEEPDSRVRAVVQVHVLDEGWDVTNVYVIATLRNVDSYRNARQLMGRGLRLPAGRRIGNDEVDTLDVLAFGQETFEKIFEQAKEEFGSPDASEGGIEVVPAGVESDTKKLAVKHPDDAKKPKTKVVTLTLEKPASVRMPVLDLIPHEPDLDLLIDVGGLTSSDRATFDLGTLTTSSLGGDLQISRARFVDIAIEGIFLQFVFLSDPLHRGVLTELVEGLLDQVCPGADEVSIDPMLCAKVVVEALSLRYREYPPRYEVTGEMECLEICPADANVPLEYGSPVDDDSVWSRGWSRQSDFRIPICGWKRCTHDAVHFDSNPEFNMAHKLDRMSEVDLWLRNEPGQVIIPTTVGNTKPDFVVWLADGRVLLLEIKGMAYWEPGRSESWVRARDMKEWCRAANSGDGDDLIFVVLLESKVDSVQSVADIIAADELRAP